MRFCLLPAGLVLWLLSVLNRWVLKVLTPNLPVWENVQIVEIFSKKYLFKIVNGVNASDIYYGMIQIITITPGASIAYGYRIADQYAHLSVAQ
jgi:hypothetical protein